MAKAKKVDLKSFHIHQVDNGWAVDAYTKPSWYDPLPENITNVFTDLDDLMVWIEANI